MPIIHSGRTDDRAVSEVLGAILIFALVLALVVIIQVSAVPAMNQQIEYSHNQRVHGDMQMLAEHVDYTAATGAQTSSNIEMGVYYPTRIFLLNPPPASASLTTEPTSVTLRNVHGTGETRDYWTGDEKSFESRRLTYAPDYNEYATAPNTVYEGWTLYNEHPGGTDLTLDKTSPITDNRIRLVALDGRRAETSTAGVTVSAEPLSVPEQTISVRDDGEPIELTFQTKLSESAWNKTLADETCTDADDNNVCDAPNPGGHIVDWRVSGETLTVVLEKNQTYDLRMSKVGIGSQTTEEPPHYMTAVDPPQVINPGGSEFTIEVRDRFNTVREGVDVTWRVESGSATLSKTTVTTDEEGRATIRGVPTSDESVTIVAEADLDGDATIEEHERVRFSNLPISDSTQTRDPSDINPADDDSVTFQKAFIEEVTTGTGQTRTTKYYVDVTWLNRYSGEKTIAAMRVNFYGMSALGGRAGTDELNFVRVDGNLMEMRGPYTTGLTLNENPIPGGDTATYRFEFLYGTRKEAVANFQPLEGDFFVVSLKFSDGTTSRYFIDPREP